MTANNEKNDETDLSNIDFVDEKNPYAIKNGE